MRQTSIGTYSHIHNWPISCYRTIAHEYSTSFSVNSNVSVRYCLYFKYDIIFLRTSTKYKVTLFSHLFPTSSPGTLVIIHNNYNHYYLYPSIEPALYLCCIKNRLMQKNAGNKISFQSVNKLRTCLDTHG